MSRLIDADLLIEEIRKRDFAKDCNEMRANKNDTQLSGFYEGYTEGIILLQPTAYDTEKVVADLKDNCDIYSVKYYQENVDVKAVQIDDAIDIVRKGGIE